MPLTCKTRISDTSLIATILTRFLKLYNLGAWTLIKSVSLDIKSIIVRKMEENNSLEEAA